jgi:hypothetical protein
LSPISRWGFSFWELLSTVASTRETSCGEALSVWRARGIEEPSENAMIFVPLPRLVFPTDAPFFGHHKRAVYVARWEIYLPSLFEIFCQSFKHVAQNPFLDPSLKAAVAGLG